MSNATDGFSERTEHPPATGGDRAMRCIDHGVDNCRSCFAHLGGAVPFGEPERTCTCPTDGCDEEGEPGCAYCQHLASEEPCPADPTTYESLVEDLIDRLTSLYGFEGVVVDPTGGEPFASLDLGHGLVFDLSATLRRTDA